MAKSTLDYSVINSCAQYAQALMLMVGVAKQVPAFKSTLKDIYPRFVEEGGGEMHIHLGEYGYSLHLTSTENGIHKKIQLPLKTTEPKDYLRHLWAYNTHQLPYTPLPDSISEAISEFHSMPSSERPKHFAVRDDRDRVLKRITEYIDTTQGGAISLEEAEEIVLKAMLSIGVLPAQGWDNEQLIGYLDFSDYSQEIAALKPPKKPKKPKEPKKPKKPKEPKKPKKPKGAVLPPSSSTLSSSASSDTVTVSQVKQAVYSHPAIVTLLLVLLFLAGFILGHFIL
jgi:hypothetical protein